MTPLFRTGQTTHPRRRHGSNGSLGAVGLLGIWAAASLGGCGTGPEPRHPEGSACPELPGSPRRGTAFTFALTAPVDASHAPVPTNDAEAILFPLVYETLVHRTCDGRLEPGLASAWNYDAGSLEWHFELRDGAALHPGAVKSAWLETRRALGRPSPEDDLLVDWMWADVKNRTIRPIPKRRSLAIAWPHDGDELPALLSLPAFGVRRIDGIPPGAIGWHTEGWPRGTRGRLDGPAEPAVWRTGSQLVWRSDARSGPSEIRFLPEWWNDPRDLVPARADAIFVRDREVVAYFRGVPEVLVTAFPFSRRYLLLTCEEDLARRVNEDAVNDLVERVVAAEARPALHFAKDYRRMFPHDDPPPFVGAGSIVYPEEDDDAHSIAERLAFLRGSLGDREARALGVKRERFLALLADGTASAYVLPLPPPPVESMRRTRLAASAPWLVERGVAIPLLETRGHLVSRVGLTGIEASPDGLPRLERAGFERGRGLP